MKKYLKILFFLFTIRLSYCQTLYHPVNFITQTGDTLNKKNSLDQFNGLQLISGNPNMLLSDTTYYQKGYLINGIPDGEWITHKASGRYCKGAYLKKYFPSDSIKYDKKIGLWQLYEISIHKSYSIKTIKQSTDSTFSDFTVQLFQKEKLVKDSSYRIIKQLKYDNNGELTKKMISNSFRKKKHTYYSETHTIKAKTRLSYVTNIYRCRFYETNGKLSSKTKTYLCENRIQVFPKKGKCKQVKVKNL